MKRKTDFFEVFRESGRHLKISPSGTAWSKLERRLEAQKKRRRRLHLISISGIAATILLLVVLAALIPVLSHRQSKSSSPETFQQGVTFEALPLLTETDMKILKAIEFSRNNAGAFNSIEEGARSKNLIPAPRIGTVHKEKGTQ